MEVVEEALVMLVSDPLAEVVAVLVVLVLVLQQGLPQLEAYPAVVIFTAELLEINAD
jgi:hypothetical protein